MKEAGNFLISSFFSKDQDWRTISLGSFAHQSRPSEAREALVAYQEIQERRLTPPPWLDQLRSKFRNIVRAGAAPMCTKKKFQKYLPKKYGCVTYLQPCVFNERALRDETSGRVFLCSFSLTCAIFRSALSIAAMQRHPILIINSYLILTVKVKMQNTFSAKDLKKMTISVP